MPACTGFISPTGNGPSFSRSSHLLPSRARSRWGTSREGSVGGSIRGTNGSTELEHELLMYPWPNQCLRACFAVKGRGGMAYAVRHDANLSKRSLRRRVGSAPTAPLTPISACQTPAERVGGGIVYRRKGMHAGMHTIGSKQVQCESCRSPRIAACLANSTPSTSGCNHACTLVIHDNDATWGDLALRHLERRRDCAIGKQPFATAQRQRIYL
jgi:hypothetical protein